MRRAWCDAGLIGLCLLAAGCIRLGFQQPPDARPVVDLRGSEPRDQGALDARVDRATAPSELGAPDRSSFSEKPPTVDLPWIKDKPLVDQAVVKDAPKIPAKDAPTTKDTKPTLDTKALPKDASPPKDVAAKDKPKPDLKPGEPLGFNPNGGYSIAPAVTYNCAFGIVNFTISSATFVDTGSQLTVSTGPTGPKGGCAVLLGDTAFDGSFTATCTYAGSCNEIYTLTGSFVGNNWNGTYTAKFTGSCLNCVNQSWVVTGTR